MFGKIKNIKKVYDFEIESLSKLNKNGKVPEFTQFIIELYDFLKMDGYKVETDKHIFYVLISNDQTCCETWGYMTSEDDLSYFVGAELLEVKVTDTALNQKILTKIDDEYIDTNQVQFVDFKTSKGTFQLAVYNSHNGFYGHKILVTKDNEVLLSDTL